MKFFKQKTKKKERDQKLTFKDLISGGIGWDIQRRNMMTDEEKAHI